MARKLVLDGGADDSKRIGVFLGAIFREFSVDVETKSEAALLRSAIMVETTAKLLFRPRTAESIDGVAPRVQTGLLRSSITHRLKRDSLNKMTAEVGTNVEYAEGLEYGTTRTMRHPFLHPALDRNVQEIIKLERDAVREAAKNAT